MLDWEKAFDKVSHEGLHNALARMCIPQQRTNLSKQLYNKTTISVIEIDGTPSTWKQQTSGIRQGCPLSQHLFLILMTVMFHDVHNDPGLERDSKDNTLLGVLFHEIL